MNLLCGRADFAVLERWDNVISMNGFSSSTSDDDVPGKAVKLRHSMVVGTKRDAARPRWRASNVGSGSRVWRLVWDCEVMSTMYLLVVSCGGT